MLCLKIVGIVSAGAASGIANTILNYIPGAKTNAQRFEEEKFAL